MSTASSKTMVAVVGVALSLMIAAGCSSSAKDKVSAVASKAACTAIGTVQSKTSGSSIEVLSDDQVAQVQATSQAATTAIDALGSKVPASLAASLDDAQTKFNAAAADTQASAEQKAANVKAAAGEYLNQLDQVKSKLKC